MIEVDDYKIRCNKKSIIITGPNGLVNGEINKNIKVPRNLASEEKP